MKKVFIIIASLLTVCCSLCSCSDNNKIVFEPIDESSTSEAVSDVSDEKNDKIVFSAELASEAFLSSTNDYHSFKADGENYVSILFKTNKAVTNVELFKIRLTDDGKFAKSDVLYTLDELYTDKHLVASVLIVGTTPQMAISFTDSDGVTYIHSINKKANDKIGLKEIEIKENPESSN